MKKTDLTLDVQDYKLNIRVAGVVIHNGKVLIHRDVIWVPMNTIVSYRRNYNYSTIRWYKKYPTQRLVCVLFQDNNLHLN